MEPRLSSSKKWTSFPEEYQQKVQEVFLEAFSKELNNEVLLIDGRFYSNELYLCVGISSKEGLQQANFLVSMDFNSTKENAIGKIYVAIDCIASMMAQFFEAKRDNSEFPRVWDKITFEKDELYIQFSPVNSGLESEADKLLGIDSEEGDIIKGEDSDEDLDVLKRTIGIDESDS